MEDTMSTATSVRQAHRVMQQPLKRRRIVVILAGTCVVLLVSLGILGLMLGPYTLRVQHFPADVAGGYHADFYLYVSPGARRSAATGSTTTILVQPNNSGTNSDDPEVHRKDAWWTGFERQGIADELDVVLLVPAFLRPGEDWKIY